MPILAKYAIEEKMRTIIELLLTNNCQRDCRYCLAQTDDKSYATMQGKINEMGDYKIAGGMMNTEQLKRWLIVQKKHLPDMRLVISGGEPTIVRHYTELLDWVHGAGFAMPILYTNGLNIKDLANLSNPKDKAKIILTHHQTSDPAKTREYVQFLKDLEMGFIVKVLADKPVEKPDFGNYCKVVIEGIRKPYSKDMEEKMRQMQEHPPALDGSSPYKWRWNGHRDFIDWEWTAWKESLIFTVFPAGHIVNCHFWNDEPCGNIYEPKNILDGFNPQIAWCYPFNGAEADKTVTRCELLHYVNIMEEI